MQKVSTQSNTDSLVDLEKEQRVCLILGKVIG